jgi:isocitrate/isopropylmalate dehydrogenase
MLRWLGEGDAADVLMGAVERVCGRGVLTRDLGGTADTKEVTQTVCRELEEGGKGEKGEK